MWTLERHTIEMNPTRVVAAVFFNEKSTRDALADLKSAHFPADKVAVAAHGTRQTSPNAASAGDGPLNMQGDHSIFWRLRHSAQRDAHAQGPPAEYIEATSEDEPAFSYVDLRDTLGALGLAGTTIQLLEDRMGPDGFLILVDAQDRQSEAESILVRNRGMLRTAMATEPSADKLPANGASTAFEPRPAGVAR